MIYFSRRGSRSNARHLPLPNNSTMNISRRRHVTRFRREIKTLGFRENDVWYRLWIQFGRAHSEELDDGPVVSVGGRLDKEFHPGAGKRSYKVCGQYKINMWDAGGGTPEKMDAWREGVSARRCRGKSGEQARLGGPCAEIGCRTRVCCWVIDFFDTTRAKGTL